MFKLALVSSLAVSAANAVNIETDAGRMSSLHRSANYRHSWAFTPKDSLFPRQQFLKQISGEEPWEGRIRGGAPRSFRNKPSGLVGDTIATDIGRGSKSTPRGLDISPFSSNEKAVRERLSQRYGGRRTSGFGSIGAPRFSIRDMKPTSPLRPPRPFDNDFRESLGLKLLNEVDEDLMSEEEDDVEAEVVVVVDEEEEKMKLAVEKRLAEEKEKLAEEQRLADEQERLAEAEKLAEALEKEEELRNALEEQLKKEEQLNLALQEQLKLEAALLEAEKEREEEEMRLADQLEQAELLRQSQIRYQDLIEQDEQRRLELQQRQEEYLALQEQLREEEQKRIEQELENERLAEAKKLEEELRIAEQEKKEYELKLAEELRLA